MDIVNELRKQGIDYDEAKKNIPDRIIKTIQPLPELYLLVLHGSV